MSPKRKKRKRTFRESNIFAGLTKVYLFRACIFCVFRTFKILNSSSLGGTGNKAVVVFRLKNFKHRNSPYNFRNQIKGK